MGGMESEWVVGNEIPPVEIVRNDFSVYRKLFINNVTPVLFEKSSYLRHRSYGCLSSFLWKIWSHQRHLTAPRLWHNIELRGVYIYNIMNYSKSDFSSAAQKLVRVIKYIQISAHRLYYIIYILLYDLKTNSIKSQYTFFFLTYWIV